MKNTIGSGLTLAQAKLRHNVLSLSILGTGLVSAIIGILAYFGMNMGTFVISLEEVAYRIGISLSEEPKFVSSYPRLLVNPLNNAVPVSFHDIEIDNIIHSEGNYYDSMGLTYTAYTFYIKNEGNTTVDLNFNINFLKATNGVDSALRILVIEDETKKTVYLKDDGDDIYIEGTPKNAKIDESEYNLVFFYSDGIPETVIEDFRPGQIKKYSVVIWLEGWDIQCDDSIKSGQLRLDLNFSVVSSRVDEENQ